MPLIATEAAAGEPRASTALHARASENTTSDDPARLRVHSVAQGEGVFFWEVAGPRRADVEREVTNIQSNPFVAASEFYRPWREFPDGRQQFRATGYTRLTQPRA